MTALDVAMLASYCEAYAELQAASEVIHRRGRTFSTPSGYRAQRPEVGIAHKAMLLIRLLAGEFGFSPSSRMRLAATTGAGGYDEDGYDENGLDRDGGRRGILS